MEKKVPSFLHPKVQISRVSFVVLLFVVALSLFITFQHKREIAQLKQNEKLLNTKIEELTKENDDLKISSGRVVLHRPKLSIQEIQYLKDQGLRNPVNDITADLMKHPELIPYRGVLGGRMGFYSESDIFVISNKLVRASFDDGHTGGWLLLEYQVTGKNEISWKVLESYSD